MQKSRFTRPLIAFTLLLASEGTASRLFAAQTSQLEFAVDLEALSPVSGWFGHRFDSTSLVVPVHALAVGPAGFGNFSVLMSRESFSEPITNAPASSSVEISEGQYPELSELYDPHSRRLRPEKLEQFFQAIFSSLRSMGKHGGDHFEAKIIGGTRYLQSANRQDIDLMLLTAEETHDEVVPAFQTACHSILSIVGGEFVPWIQDFSIYRLALPASLTKTVYTSFKIHLLRESVPVRLYGWILYYARQVLGIDPNKLEEPRDPAKDLIGAFYWVGDPEVYDAMVKEFHSIQLAAEPALFVERWQNAFEALRLFVGDPTNEDALLRQIERRWHEPVTTTAEKRAA